MKFIRTNQIFCFLRNLTVLRRQKLRTYRSIQNIQKNLCKFLIFAGICIISYQMTYQRLRHGTVDCIHGHMITIISCPPKCQFGKVSCSNDNTTGLVCNIHQDLRTFPCLSVLISDIMYFRIVSDITEMQVDRFTDIDFFQSCPQTFA